jgi:hypothetical protein
MRRLIALLLLAGSLHAAGPVRVAFDSQVVDWDKRCLANNLYGQPNYTFSLVASSQFMGSVRAAELYPGNLMRVNLMCGRSYGGTSGAGDNSSSSNIGAPGVPLINDVGYAIEGIPGTGGCFQNNWQYHETGTNGGLGCFSGNPFLNTGVVPSAVSAWMNDVHVCLYMMGGATEAAIPIGSSDSSSGNAIWLTVNYSGVGQNTALWAVSVGPTSADTAGAGWYCGTRTTNTTSGIRQYHNATATGSASAVSGDPAANSYSIFMFAEDYLGNQSARTTHLSGGYALGRGITAAVATNYYNAWQQFETLLARQK